ncbi:MAG TPA: SCO family protein [Gaiellaceae bacterium]|jgi:protein SCO1/2|nr:SCO family protein [Gaiellaceae bacterium]
MRLALLLVALLGALAIPAAFLLTRGDGTRFRGSTAPAGFTLPAFALQDDEGRMVRSDELRGKAVAVTFLDAQCTEACPVIAAQVGQAVRALGQDRTKIEALAISVDPRHDTRAAIDAFLHRFRAKGELRYLDGSLAQLRPLWREFAVAASAETGNSNMHSAPVRVYDGEGRWRSTLHPGADLTPANLVHDLEAALRSS